MTFREKIERWATLIKQTRAFFEERNFIEVFTPYLVKSGAFESAIDALKVNSLDMELHTSPEIEMKWLLSNLKAPIYQIAKSFRDDDPNTGTHLKEFTMLEFYRPNCNYSTVMNDTKELFEKLADQKLDWQMHRVPDLFVTLTNTDWIPLPSEDFVRKNLKNIIELSADDSIEEIFLKLLIEKVEPKLSKASPTILDLFPESLSPLSKARGDGWAERFEVYWGKMEIANGCAELDSFEEAKNRYEQESKKRASRGKKPHPQPLRLFESMKKGVTSSGVAVGLDRLFWAMYGELPPSFEV